MGAFDLWFSGIAYTWCNRQWGNVNIRERLNRVVVNAEWRILFNQAGVIHLSLAGSDHTPIHLSLKQNHPSLPRLFCFLEIWTRDHSCEKIISEAWWCRDRMW